MFNDNQNSNNKSILFSKGINILNKYSMTLVSNIQFIKTSHNDEENILLCVAKPSGRCSHQEPCVVWTKPMSCMYKYIFACMNMGVSRHKTRRNEKKVLYNETNVWRSSIKIDGKS